MRRFYNKCALGINPCGLFTFGTERHQRDKNCSLPASEMKATSDFLFFFSEDFRQIHVLYQVLLVLFCCVKHGFKKTAPGLHSHSSHLTVMQDAQRIHSLKVAFHGYFIGMIYFFLTRHLFMVPRIGKYHSVCFLRYSCRLPSKFCLKYFIFVD